MILKADVGKASTTARYLTRGGAHRVLEAVSAGIKSGALVGVSVNVWAPLEMQGKPGHPWFVTVLGEDPVVVDRAAKVLASTKNSNYGGQAECPVEIMRAMIEKRWRAIREHRGRGFADRQPDAEDGAFIKADGTIEYVDSVPA